MAETRTVAGMFSPPAAHQAKESLVIVAPNNINPLGSEPRSEVLFFLNGEIVDGITNDGTAITVNPVVLGVNIGPTDTVKAIYS